MEQEQDNGGTLSSYKNSVMKEYYRKAAEVLGIYLRNNIGC